MINIYHTYRPSFKTALKRQLTPYQRPAELFEQRYGVFGISRNYALPRPFSAELLEDFLHDYLSLAYRLGKHWPLEAIPESYKESMEIADGIADDLIHQIQELNPELKEFPYAKNDIVDLYDTLHGISSGLNPADIRTYIQYDQAARNHSKPEIVYPEELKENLELLDRSMTWHPSLETMLEVERQLRLKIEADSSLTLASILKNPRKISKTR